ncbi:MAG: hypothetical protein ACYDEJ_09580 [Desulfitobacteriaceae bacterium]
MKTYLKDFSMQRTELIKGCSELEELISNRRDRFSLTIEHKETSDKVEDLLNKLMNLPEAKEIVENLEEEITYLGCVNYSAAYKDGMTDLMAALTLNKLNITKVDYFKVP